MTIDGNQVQNVRSAASDRLPRPSPGLRWNVREMARPPALAFLFRTV